MPADSKQESQEYLELIAGAIHQISHDLHRLTQIAEKHAPLLDAYQRGGLLAMRQARRTAERTNGGKNA